MGSMVSVTQERRIRTSPGVVWSVVTTPEMQAHLDPRCRLVTTKGNGEVGSEFVLSVGKGLAEAHLRYVVREAIPESRWVAAVRHREKEAAIQHGELARDGAFTLLRWTVTIRTGPLTRRLALASCQRELTKWLASVDRVALAQAPR